MNRVFLTIFSILKFVIISCHFYIDQEYLNSTYLFLRDFLQLNATNECNYTNYIDVISDYSFTKDNELGNFKACYDYAHYTEKHFGKKNMSYFMFFYVNKDYFKGEVSISNVDEFQVFYGDNLSLYYKESIFYRYHLYTLCLPYCLKNQIDSLDKMSGNNLFEQTHYNSIKKNKTVEYVLRTTDALPENISALNPLSVSLMIIFFFVLFVSILCSIFPNCFKAGSSKSSSEENTQVRDNNNHDEYFEGYNSQLHIDRNNKSNNTHNSFYSFLVSVFSLRKNMKRIFKETSEKQNIHSCYINDSSLSFVNGLKALNLIVVVCITVYWLLLTLPLTYTIGFDVKEEVITSNNFSIFLLQYLYYCIYLHYSLSGFVLAFKFLSHMKENPKHKSKLRMLMNFLFKHTYRYFTGMLFYLIVCKIHIITITIFNSKGSGPLYVLYQQLTDHQLSKWYEFFFLYVSFFTDDATTTHNNSFLFFFVYINEIYCFFICTLILYLYYHNNKNGYAAIIFSYVFTILMRFISTFCFIREQNIRDFYFYQIFNLKYFFSIPTYLIGVLFGILYFEHNHEDHEEMIITKLTAVENSEMSVSYEEVQQRKPNNIGKRIVKHFANNSIIHIFLLIVFFLVWCLTLIIFSMNFVVELREMGFLGRDIKITEIIFAILNMDTQSILLFLIIFKYVIFSNSMIKEFLESTFWVPFSRLYYTILCIFSGFTYYFILTISQPIRFNLMNDLFLTLSMICLLFIYAFLISLVFELPLKIGFKKIANKLL
jgi:hypothetical protein